MKKVVFCKWTSICETGIDNGFKKSGYDITRITRLLDSVDYDMEYGKLLSDTILQAKPDCVFSVNFIPIISRICNIHKVPYVCWIVDSPCFQLYSNTISNSFNNIYIFDRDLYNQFYHKNPDGIFHLPLACDIDTWDSINVTNEHHKLYDCDISFVGSLYTEKTRYNSIENIPPYIQGYVDGLINAQLNVLGYNFIPDSLTEEFVTEFKKCAKWVPLADDYEENDLRIISDTYIGYKCTEQDRIRTLNALTKYYNVDLYTLSDTSTLENVNLRGPADSNNMMPYIMKCSKINLNMTNKPISSGLPLRIFDILGSGGFLISNYQPEIPELFEIGKEIVVYESIPDLIEKVNYYLHNEDERLEIAKNGHDKVAIYHSYDVKLKYMIEEATNRGY